MDLRLVKGGKAGCDDILRGERPGNLCDSEILPENSQTNKQINGEAAWADTCLSASSRDSLIRVSRWPESTQEFHHSTNRLG